MTVIVTTPSFGRQSRAPWDALDAHGIAYRRATSQHPMDAATLAKCAVGAQALIVGLDEVDEQVLRTPGLKVVAKHGVGVDNIDLVAAQAAGVHVVNAPGSNSVAVAEATIGCMLVVARRLVEAHNAMMQGTWGSFPGLELSGRTLGVVGFGRIGQAVASRAKALGMHIVAFDPFVPDSVFSEAGVEQAALAEVIARGHVVTLHAPGTDGAQVIDESTIATMQDQAILINAARGGLVDEAAVASALHTGKLFGAAFDAFGIEPLPVESPLRSAPNVLLTPHLGAHADGANATMGTIVVDDVARVLRGEEPLNSVTSQ